MRSGIGVRREKVEARFLGQAYAVGYTLAITIAVNRTCS